MNVALIRYSAQRKVFLGYLLAGLVLFLLFCSGTCYAKDLSKEVDLLRNADSRRFGQLATLRREWKLSELETALKHQQAIEESSYMRQKLLRARAVLDVWRSCVLEGIPEDARVYATSGYGKYITIPVLLDGETDATTIRRVLVSDTEKPVVLVLMGDGPNVWQVETCQGVVIAGVLATGRGRQAVIGIDSNTPLRLLSRTASISCPILRRYEGQGHRRGGAAPGSPGDWEEFQQSVEAITGLRDTQYVSGRGMRQIALGPQGNSCRNGYQQPRAPLRLAHYPAEGTVSSGRAGVDELIREGRIRRASTRDIESWISGAEMRDYQGSNLKWVTQALRSLQSESKAFVILEKIRIPTGLHGAHRLFFLIPEHVEKPDPVSTHAQCYYMKNFSARNCGDAPVCDFCPDIFGKR